MAIKVRPARWDVDRAEILALLERNLGALPHARRLDWLYRQNPCGPAWSWLACEQESERPVGLASVFPRAMWVGPRVEMVGQVGDFAVDISHRSLGPALMLQRATLGPVKSGGLAFCYDCPPHRLGMATFQRLGIEPSCQMRRYARPLRTERQLRKHFGQGPLVDGLASLGNFALSVLQSARRPGEAGLEIALHNGPFGEEFSRLDQEVGGGDLVRARRRAEDLNWRFQGDPLHNYHVLTARRRGELAGFCVFSVTEGDVWLIDLFASAMPGVGLALLDAVVGQAKKNSAHTLHALVTEGGALSGLLRSLYFRSREMGKRVVTYAQPDGQVCSFLAHGAAWCMNHADVLA